MPWQELRYEVDALSNARCNRSSIHVHLSEVIDVPPGMNEVECDRHVSREQMRVLYSRAVRRGRELGKGLWKRLPGRGTIRLRLPRLPGRRRGLKSGRNLCKVCGKRNPKKASYCGYCGEPLEEIQITGTAVSNMDEEGGGVEEYLS